MVEKPTYQELEDSISRYEKLIHSVSEGFLEADKQGNITKVNIPFAEMCGYKSTNEMLGINIITLFVNTADRDIMLKEIKKTGSIKNHELQLKRKDGSSFWSLNNMSNLVNAEGEVVGKQGLILDITERKKTELALKESEKKRRDWIENSPACTKIIDLNLNIHYMSRAGIEGLKIKDVNEYYGKPFPFPFYPKSLKESITKKLEEAKATGEKTGYEAALIDLEGNKVALHSIK